MKIRIIEVVGPDLGGNMHSSFCVQKKTLFFWKTVRHEFTFDKAKCFAEGEVQRAKAMRNKHVAIVFYAEI